MTKKDYVAIAKIMFDLRFYSLDQIHVDKVIEPLANLFQANNPAFNRHRFLVACGARQEETR